MRLYGYIQEVGSLLNLSDATVICDNTDSSNSVVSDSTGLFDFTELDYSDAYDLTFSKIGYVTDIEKIQVRPQYASTVRVKKKLSPITRNDIARQISFDTTIGDGTQDATDATSTTVVAMINDTTSQIGLLTYTYQYGSVTFQCNWNYVTNVLKISVPLFLEAIFNEIGSVPDPAIPNL